MQSFKIAIADNEIDDLKARLTAARFAPTLPDAGWEYGMDEAFLRRFTAYWQKEFDWRAAEKKLNEFNQFTTEIHGERVHFVHARGRGETNVPLLLTNGWPANFVELLPLVPLLTEPRDGTAFDIIIPSLPGYGFSGQPTQRGMNLSRVAPLWAELMSLLGYDKFLVSGSDLGAGVEMALVRNFPERLLGAHYVNVFSGFPRPEDPTPEETEYFQQIDWWNFAEGAYAMVHGTKPATLAAALNDSPVGLAAWILEKYHAWTDNDGNPESAVPLETLATIVSVYWFTRTIGSSMRLYKEAFADEELTQKAAEHDVPHAILLPPKDYPAPRAWAERHLRHIVRWTEMEKGGHFPALEVPEAMAEDIREFHAQIG